MRPRSILYFDLLYLAAVIAGVLNSILAFSDMTEELKNPLIVGIFGSAENLIYGSLAISLAISLLLWFFISRRASNIAKWIQVVFTAFALLSFAGIALEPDTFSTADIATIIISNAFQVAATAVLFRAESRTWFAGKRPVDPNVFS